MTDSKNPFVPADSQNRPFGGFVVTSILLGVFGALSALVFLGVTGVGARWYGKAGIGWFEGELWWVAVAAACGLIVGLMRRAFKLPVSTPGLAEDLTSGDIDMKLMPKVVAVSAVSLIGGASLGPEAALSQIGGGAGKYLARRRGFNGDETKLNTRIGIAGAFGGLFSSPLVATILVQEISTPSKMMSSRTLLGSLMASATSLGIYFALAGTAFLGLYDVPQYDYKNWHLLAGIGLGVYGAVVVIAVAAIGAVTKRLFALVSIPTVPLALLGGLIFGLIGVMLPLTNFTGTDQLSSATANAGSIGVGLLAATMIAKIFCMAVSSATGFIGGKIFPVLFIGGTAGLLVHLAIPEIPLALAFTCLLAAVPGSLGAAPFSLILITVLLTQIGTIQTSPVAIAVATSFITFTALRLWFSKWKSRSDASGRR